MSRPALEGRVSIGHFLIVVTQLALVTVIIRQFQIESSAFLRVALLAFAGFVVHVFLPLRYRLPFFVLLSLTAIALVFGPAQGAWLIGIGLVLIGICHLPLPFGARVLVLLLTGLALAAQRVAWLQAPWSQAIWPILGSMFMFRLIVYLYDIRHDSAPVSPWRTLSYFFLLPNVCFPLFPVVDYKTFRRNYYDDDPYRIYQTGVDWIVRGITHLLLYRFVYYYVTIGPSEVTGPGQLVRYMVATFLLYLRVSGQFHVIVGMLHLFGFRLPETNHRYYLASSFTDFWRRINIYWKDFMLKVFYYPVYFKLRRWGTTKALVISTFFVFFATWLLHAYQWFWLRGSFLLAVPDLLFWSVLALLVVVNVLWEAKHGRARTLRTRSWTFRGAASLGLRTVGTFGTICILWSLWSSESLSAWFSLLTGVGERTTADAVPLAVLVVAAVAVGGSAGTRLEERGTGRRKELSSCPRSTVVTIALLLVLSLVGIPAVYTQFGPSAATFAHSLRSPRLNRVDTALLERGYYEDLLRVDRFNSQLWEVYMNKPLHWLDIQGGGIERFTGDFLQKELLPSSASLTRYGMISTNRWGMRDRDYEKLPPPGTYRVALLGASSVMGWGVGDGETFESLLEERLNRERTGRPYARYEVLNFAVPGYQPPQLLMVLDKAFSFRPDALFYVATGREGSRTLRYLVEVVQKKIDLPYDYFQETVRKAGIDANMEEGAAVRRLEPFRGDLLAWLYRRVVERCRERGILPVLVFLPQVTDGPWREETPEILRSAQQAGFVVLSLEEIYRNQDITSLRLAAWDNHPNVKGHQLIAARLWEALEEKEDVIFARHSASARQP